MSSQDWYSNKDLFEMIQSFNTQVVDLQKEMKKTATLIRDYNGLRGTINDVDKRLAKIEQTIVSDKDNEKEEKQIKRDYIGWAVAFIMLILHILSYIKGG